MKKLLLLGVFSVLFSCGSRDDDNNLSGNNGTGTTITNQGSGIGKVDFTFNGKNYSYTNHNMIDGGYIQTIDGSKPSLFWENGLTSGGIGSIFKSGLVNGKPYDISTITVSLTVIHNNYDNSKIYGIIIYKGNGTSVETTNCTNPKITYTIDSKNRISGNFTSDQCNGTFKDIVRGN